MFLIQALFQVRLSLSKEPNSIEIHFVYDLRKIIRLFLASVLFWKKIIILESKSY